MSYAALIRKYNVPAPRYTSYPTVPFWSDTPSVDTWKEKVLSVFGKTNSEKGITIIPTRQYIVMIPAMNTAIGF